MKHQLIIGNIVLSSFFCNDFNLNGDHSNDLVLEVKAGAILNVGITTATIGGSIITDSLSDITLVGICWNTHPDPVIDDYKLPCYLDSADFICMVDNLVPGTLYFIRTYATTSSDTVYSENKIFYTHRTNSVPDIDGNYYNTIKIGNQYWLAEDLKTTRLNDGTPIPLVARNSEWTWRKIPAYCWYGNDSTNFSFPRGKLYNWFTVETEKLCPVGWHVPSDEEWAQLQTFLGGDSIAGGKMKTTGTYFWRHPNQRATNESGFSAIPGGYRNNSGTFSFATIFNSWWSSTEYPPDAAYIWYVYHARGYLYHESAFKMYGYSVRCIKDK